MSYKHEHILSCMAKKIVINFVLLLSKMEKKTVVCSQCIGCLGYISSLQRAGCTIMFHLLCNILVGRKELIIQLSDILIVVFYVQIIFLFVGKLFH